MYVYFTTKQTQMGNLRKKHRFCIYLLIFELFTIAHKNFGNVTLLVPLSAVINRYYITVHYKQTYSFLLSDWRVRDGFGTSGLCG